MPICQTNVGSVWLCIAFRSVVGGLCEPHHHTPACGRIYFSFPPFLMLPSIPVRFLFHASHPECGCLSCVCSSAELPKFIRFGFVFRCTSLLPRLCHFLINNTTFGEKFANENRETFISLTIVVCLGFEMI